ncbi:MAG: BON domain-containing protein [Anaerolineae bacterium]|nr:BON domain-containing protein [Anaerolineae bacterium]
MSPRSQFISDSDDDQEDFDVASDAESDEGGENELLVGLSGRPGADTFDPVEALDDIGEYEGSEASLPPDYSYRVSASVSDRYGEYPYPGDEDVPLGYATDDSVAAEEGLAYFPPEDPATMRGAGAGDELEIAAGFAPSASDAGFGVEDLPRRVQRGDYDLAEEVLEAIESASELTGFRLRVRVRHGVVHVCGYVSTMEDLAILEDVIREVPGVVDVDAERMDLSDDSIEGIRIVTSKQVATDGDLEEEL